MFPMTRMRSDTGNILRSERKLSEKQREMCRQYSIMLQKKEEVRLYK